MPYIEPEEYRPEPPLRPQITGPLAWEDPAAPFARRLFSTLAATFAPLETLYAVSNGPIAPAVWFAVVTSLPFMMLWAVPWYTHTLIFGKLTISYAQPEPATLAVVLDVLQAAGIGLALSLVSLVSRGAPFVSLVRAFADASREEDPRTAAIRTTLYRLWVIPFGMTCYSLMLCALPGPALSSAFLQEVSLIGFQALPRVLMLVHFHAMARYFGASGFGALAVSVVPLTVEWALALAMQEVVAQLLPPMPGEPAP